MVEIKDHFIVLYFLDLAVERLTVRPRTLDLGASMQGFGRQLALVHLNNGLLLDLSISIRRLNGDLLVITHLQPFHSLFKSRNDLLIALHISKWLAADIGVDHRLVIKGECVFD